MSNSLDPDRADVVSGPIWIQTDCKGYQQMTPVGEELLPWESKNLVMLDKILTLCMLGNFFTLLLSADFFQNKLF